MRFMLASARLATLTVLAAALVLTQGGAALSPAAGAAPGAVADGVAPPTDPVTLSVLSVNGSGCPAGTAKVTMLSDNTGFRIVYSNFVAQTGGTALATDFRKNCQVSVAVHVPQGFTFAIARADYRGKARLASGVTGLQRTNYYFQGDSDNNYTDHPFTGPLNATWHTTDITDASALVFQPCGVTLGLNINTELRVDSGSSSAVNVLTMSASDGSVDTIAQFQWMQCP